MYVILLCHCSKIISLKYINFLTIITSRFITTTHGYYRMTITHNTYQSTMKQCIKRWKPSYKNHRHTILIIRIYAHEPHILTFEIFQIINQSPPKYATILHDQYRQYVDSSSVALFGNGKGFYEHVRSFNTAISYIRSFNIHR